MILFVLQQLTKKPRPFVIQLQTQWVFIERKKGGKFVRIFSSMKFQFQFQFFLEYLFALLLPLHDYINIIIASRTLCTDSYSGVIARKHNVDRVESLIVVSIWVLLVKTKLEEWRWSGMVWIERKFLNNKIIYDENEKILQFDQRKCVLISQQNSTCCCEYYFSVFRFHWERILALKYISP